MSEPADQQPGPEKIGPLVEIGWILAGRFESADEAAILKCRQTLQSLLERMFPEFRWRMPIIQREHVAHDIRVEPIELLDVGVAERDIRHWDFTFVVTGADLRSYTKPYCTSVISRSYDSAVFSTSRIDPAIEAPGMARRERSEVMATRLIVLILNAFGHLNGMEHSLDVDRVQYELEESDDLDHAAFWSEEEVAILRYNLLKIADLRLEESSEYQQIPAWRFYFHSAWRNRSEIRQSIRQARPWEFPYRLSRLTVAAVSTTAILLMTAEAWELGMSQPLYRALTLPTATVLITTFYVVKRQGLLVRRRAVNVSEQTTITTVATFAIVLVGMITTLLGLFSLALAFSLVFFPRPLVEHWAESVREIGWISYVQLALFIASFGIAIGALGASFEGQNYFRHVTYVDVEI